MDFLQYPRTFLSPPLSREQALEIAKTECQRRAWPFAEHCVQIKRKGRLWEILPVDPPRMVKGLIYIYIRIEDGTIKHASAVLYEQFSQTGQGTWSASDY